MDRSWDILHQRGVCERVHHENISTWKPTLMPSVQQRWSHAQAHTLGGAAAALGAALMLAGSGLLSGCTQASKPGEPLQVEAVIGETGSYPGQFSYPRAIDTDGRSLWVIDKLARVQRFDPRTGEPLVWFRMPEFKLGKPTGITIASATYPDKSIHDAIYIADTHYHRVMVYALPEFEAGAHQDKASNPAQRVQTDTPREITPTLIGQFGSFGDGPGQFLYPTDIAVQMNQDRSAIEHIFVSEYGGNDRINVFGPDYDFEFAFGSLGTGEDALAIEFSRPQSLAIDPNTNELIVSDSCHHRLGRFTLDGTLLGWIGSPDPAPRPDSPGRTDSTSPVHFAYPYGLVMLADSSLLVTEFGASEVQRIDLTTGTSLGRYGAPGRGEGQLSTPWASVVIGQMTYVLDSGNNRILAAHLPGIRSRVPNGLTDPDKVQQ